MPKIAYITHKFQQDALLIIASANRVIENYRKQGYTLTLRGLYYQFIAEDLFSDDWIDEDYNLRNRLDPRTKNTVKNYKRLGSLINDARLAGLIDWEGIEDRMRDLSERPHWDGPKEFMESVIPQYHIDLWADQKSYVEVWGEKDAISNILEKACKPLDVPFFVCRGNTSQSEMWQAAQRIGKRIEQGRKAVILHVGDHDPTGVDMTRDIRDRLTRFCEYDVADVPTVVRIGLTMDQILELNPPPNPVKATDSRSTKYVEEFGSECWELDAMKPDYLVSLVHDRILDYLDVVRFNARIRKESLERKEMMRTNEGKRKKKG